MHFNQLLRIMQLTALSLTVFCLHLYATADSQKVSYAGKNVELEKVLSAVSQQTGYYFFYSKQILSDARPVTINVRDVPVGSFLNLLFESQPLTYSLQKTTVIIKKKDGQTILIDSVTGFHQPVSPPVNGVVRGADGQFLANVNILVKGTDRGTTTDSRGRFSIEAGIGDILVVSFIGYDSQEIRVSDDSPINIILSFSQKSMNEIVVIGYQQIQRKKSTMAISSLSGKDVENLPAPSVDVLLQGKIPGVNVQNFTGMPGVKTSLMIRGNTKLMSPDSFNGDLAFSNPLYVIDGIPISDDEVRAFDGTGINFLTSLNPNDIESIDVLKDASAAAIYGSRGANGVIIIKTKRGSIGAPRFSLNAYYGIVEKPRLVETVYGAEERRRKMELMRHYGDYQKFYNQLPQMLTDSLNPAFNNSNDWQALFYQPGNVKNVDFAISGGTENLTYRVSAGLYDEKGIIINTGYKRYGLIANFGIKPTSRIEWVNNIRLTHGIRDVGKGTGYRNVFTISPITMPSSLFYLSPQDQDVIIAPYKYQRNDNRNNNVDINSMFIVHVTKNISWTTRGALSYQNTKNDYFSPSFIEADGLSKASSYYSQYTKYIITNHLTWNKTFGNDHSVVLFGGQEFERRKNEDISISAFGIPNDNIRVISGAPNSNVSSVTDLVTYAKLSWLASLHYDYKSKYLVDFFWRADASSRFGVGNKWGYFPSVSAAWSLHEEPLVRSLLPGVSFLKLRASYGINGDEASIGDMSRYNAYQVSNAQYNGSTATTYDGVPTINPNFEAGITRRDLTWEQSRQWNAGIDLSFLNNRINMNVDFYQRTTEGQMLNVWVPETSGYSKSLSNAAGVRNSGIEINVTTRNLPRSSELQWTSIFNISFNKNKVYKLPDNNRDIYIGFDVAAYVVGKPLNMYKLFITEGIINSESDMIANPYTGAIGSTPWGPQKLGYPKWRDLNGDFRLWDDDMTFYGDPNPLATGGLTNVFTWKNFTLQFLLTYTMGRTIVNNTLGLKLANGLFYGDPNTFARISMADFSKYNYWREPGDNATFPRFDPWMGMYAWRTNQSLFIEPGSYLRMKSIGLSYKIQNNNVARSLGLNNVRLYSNIDNLFILQRFSGIDAEQVNAQGRDFGDGYPIPKKITFGVTVDF